jgi:hypothetical protein
MIIERERLLKALLSYDASVPHLNTGRTQAYGLSTTRGRLHCKATFQPVVKLNHGRQGKSRDLFFCTGLLDSIMAAQCVIDHADRMRSQGSLQKPRFIRTTKHVICIDYKV